MRISEAGALISIRKSAEELDRLEQLLGAAADAYAHAIWSTSQYAVELDPGDLAAFRGHLNGLKQRVGSASAKDDWESLQASFRGELRDYRDQTADRIKQLRAEIVAAAEAMQTFADSVASSGADHLDDLEHALGELDGIASLKDLAAAQAVVASAREAIAVSVERMRKQHQMIVAQLRDELRLLHQQIETERKAAFLDRATGAWNAQKMGERVKELIEKDRPFCIILVCVRNLKRLERTHSRTVVEGGLKALLRRFHAQLGDDAMIGRTDETSFAAIVFAHPAEAIRISRDAAKRLAGSYSVQENGLAHSVALQVAAGVIDHAAGADGPSFEQKLVQMSEALSAA